MVIKESLIFMVFMPCIHKEVNLGRTGDSTLVGTHQQVGDCSASCEGDSGPYVGWAGVEGLSEGL